MPFFPRQMSGDEMPDMSAFFEAYTWFGPIMILMALVIFGWMWVVGTSLQEKLPPFVQFNFKRFNWFIGIPFVYLIIISLGMSWLFAAYIPGIMESRSDIAAMGGLFLILFFIVPLHLFSIFGIFWSMVFTARVIKSVELQRKARFEDAVAEFFLIWFFLIGVWILQPKINRIFSGEVVFKINENA